MSEHEGDGGSDSEGSGGGGSSSKDLESKDGSEGEGSNNEGSGSKSGETCSEDEESGSGSGSGSSASESDGEAPKAKPDQPPLKAPSEMDHKVLQAPSIPKVNDKDSEDEQKSSCHELACSLDVAFDKWRDYIISEGHEEWAKWDKMICDHADPTKRAYHPDLQGMTITYMELQGAFKPIKTSEYCLSHFYQARALGDFPIFPEPWEPTSNDVHCLLQKAHKLVQPKLVVALSQDAVTTILLLCKLHNHNSLQWLKMQTDKEVDDNPTWRLSFCQYSGSNDQSYLNHIMCGHYW